MGAKPSLSDAWILRLRSQGSFPGPGTQRWTRSICGSSRGSPRMLMGEEPQLRPSPLLCSPSPLLAPRAPRANRGRRYLCSIRRDLGGRGAAAAGNFQAVSSGTVGSAAACSSSCGRPYAGIGIVALCAVKSVLFTAVLTLIPVFRVI